MTNATKFAISAAAIALSLAGCKPQPAPAPTPSPAAVQPRGGAMVSDIGAAMQAGKRLKCTVTNTVSGQTQTTTMYVDGMKYRMESMMAAGQSVNGVYNGETFYFWGSAMPQGMMMAKGCLDQLKAMAKTAPSQGQPEYKSSAELVHQPNVKCDEVSTVDLSYPSNVNFVDQCAMMQKAAEMMKGINAPKP